MNTAKLVAVGFILFSILACSHPIEIQGEGDVRSESGARGCELEAYLAGSDSCRKNLVVNHYNETYYAEPREGWEFERWLNYCQDAKDNSCSFDIKAKLVNENWGKTAPSLVAVFKRLLPDVKMEILGNIAARDTFAGKAGVGYAYVCPGAHGSRNFLIDVPGFAPSVVNRQPSRALLENACDSGSGNLSYNRIYLKWSNGADYLQRNAGFVRAALTLISEKYALGSRDRVAMVGTSMGGVVARYALLQMENEGVVHPLDLFVTVDSPHTGAYIPVGIQHIANVFADQGGNETLTEVNTPAARQMLRYHYTSGESAQTFTDDYKQLYLNELEALGGYPRGRNMRTVAVASGRGDGIQETPFSGDRYLLGSYEVFSRDFDVSKTFNLLVTKYTFEVSYKVRLLANVSAWALETSTTGKSRVARVDLDATINGISTNDQSGLTDYFRGEVARILGISKTLIPKFIVSSIVDIASDEVDKALNTFAGQYDNRNFYASNDGRTSAGVPAGQGDSIRQLRLLLKEAGFSLSGVDPASTPPNAFIPTASALGVGSAGIGADDFGPGLSYSREQWQAASPFHRVYIESAQNQPHTESTQSWRREITALFAASQ